MSEPRSTQSVIGRYGNEAEMKRAGQFTRYLTESLPGICLPVSILGCPLGAQVDSFPLPSEACSDEETGKWQMPSESPSCTLRRRSKKKDKALPFGSHILKGAYTMRKFHKDWNISLAPLQRWQNSWRFWCPHWVRGLYQGPQYILDTA